MDMEKMVNLCKQYGFIFQGSEIYGGLANTWDYGPLGKELKENIKKAWWKKFIVEQKDSYGLDAAILMNPEVWVASGHVSSFSDPLIDCKNCKTRHRADNLISDFNPDAHAEGMTQEEMLAYINENKKNIVKVKDIYGNDTNLTASSLKENRTIKEAIYYGPEYAHTIGTAYGYVVKETKEFDNVLYSLKNNPTSRRNVVSLRQANLLKTGVLEPCVWASTYKVSNGKLNINVDVRSNDMPIGNPFNVTQYAILLSLLAKVSNLEVGNLNWTISDCHIC